MVRESVRIFYILLLLCFATFPVTPRPAAQRCRPLLRKEWRTLGRKHQLEYLDAVQCLLRLPAWTSPKVAPGAKSRFDDFVVTHIQKFFEIHFVGQFLPWHRYYTWIYEAALRDECGYTGAQPYWDWTLDARPDMKFVDSPIWDPKYGFGGNGPYTELPEGTTDVPGRTGGGCVQDGPFKDMVVNLGPLTNLTGNPRCLTRDFSPYYASRWSGMNQTLITLQQKDFGSFVRVLEVQPIVEPSGIHGGGHFSVGGSLGQMGDPWVSPADPIFYLHHANLDRVWWSWQKKDLDRRLKDISGPLFFNDLDNVIGGNTTLDYSFDLGVLAPGVTVEQIMDIRGTGLLCYDYDRLYKF